jgi:hypothetical protein
VQLSATIILIIVDILRIAIFAYSQKIDWLTKPAINALPFKVSRYSGKGTVMPEETVLIQPVTVVRDTDGWWHHPDLPMFEEEQGEESREWIKAQGLTIVTAEMEYEVDTDNDP